MFFFIFDQNDSGRFFKQLKDEEERKKPREYSRSGPEAGQSLGDLLKQKFEESEN